MKAATQQDSGGGPACPFPAVDFPVMRCSETRALMVMPNENVTGGSNPIIAPLQISEIARRPFPIEWMPRGNNHDLYVAPKPPPVKAERVRHLGRLGATCGKPCPSNRCNSSNVHINVYPTQPPFHSSQPSCFPTCTHRRGVTFYLLERGTSGLSFNLVPRVDITPSKGCLAKWSNTIITVVSHVLKK